MPYKDPEVKKAYHKLQSRKHYEKNKEKVIEATTKYAKRGKEKWDLFKGSLHCARCNENHIACMDFHHINPSEKEYEVSALISSKMFTKAYKEIKKCIVLCSNCHRKLHYNEKTPALWAGVFIGYIQIRMNRLSPMLRGGLTSQMSNAHETCNERYQYRSHHP